MPDPYYFVATAQPHVTGPPHATALFTLAEKKHLADLVGQRSMGYIPLVIDHAGIDAPGTSHHATVPPGLVMGRLLEIAVRSANGSMVIMGEFFFDHPHTRALAESIARGERWGVSLGVKLWTTPAEDRVLRKELEHIGITKNPEYGDENTWIHRLHHTWAGLYRDFLNHYEAEERGLVYMHPEAWRRLRILSAADSAPNVTMRRAVASKGPSHLAGTGRATGSAAFVHRLRQSIIPIMADTAGNTPPPSTPAPGTTPPPSTPSSSGATPNLTPGPSAPPLQHQAIDYAAMLDAVNKEVDATFNMATLPGEEVYYDADRLVKVPAYLERYDKLLTDAGVTPSSMPDEVMQRMRVLRDYKNKGEQRLRDYLAKTQIPPEQTNELLQNYNKDDRYYFYAQQVMASGNQTEKNMRQVNAKLAHAEAERLAKEKELETLKRAREETDTQMKQLREEFEAIKRQRTVGSFVGASPSLLSATISSPSFLTGSASTSAAPAAAASAVPVQATASQTGGLGSLWQRPGTENMKRASYAWTAGFASSAIPGDRQTSLVSARPAADDPRFLRFQQSFSQLAQSGAIAAGVEQDLTNRRV